MVREELRNIIEAELKDYKDQLFTVLQSHLTQSDQNSKFTRKPKFKGPKIPNFLGKVPKIPKCDKRYKGHILL